MRVKYAIIVLIDGLDHDGFVKEVLSKYGEMTGFEDHYEEPGDPMRIYFMDGTFGQYVRIKLDLNCVEARQYVLCPMASYEDKIKAQEKWA
jgi:hypothetical protein